jgi:hypothetical protein
MDYIVGFVFLGSLNANSRYQQMLMHPNNKEKKLFIIHKGMFYYQIIPFGVKNVRAIYKI